RTKPIRHNSSQVNFSIRGGGTTLIDGKQIRYSQYDTWNTPSWAIYEHVNDTNELQAGLTYSNAPLLEKMNVHIVEEEPKPSPSGTRSASPIGRSLERGQGEGHTSGQSPFGTFEIGLSGAYLMPYETLINPEVKKQ